MTYETRIINPGAFSPEGVGASIKSAFPTKYSGLIGEGISLLRLIFTEELSTVEEELVIQLFEDSRLETVMQYTVQFDMEVKE